MGPLRSRAWWVPATTIAVALALAACGTFGSTEPEQPGDGDGDGGTGVEGGSGVDGSATEGSSAADSSVVNCNAGDKFKTTSVVLMANTEGIESARLGVDGKLYVTATTGSNKALGFTTFTDGGIDTDITGLLTQAGVDDEQAMLSDDGLALVFQSDRTAPGGPSRLHVSSRATPGTAFGAPKELPFASPLSSNPTTKLQDPWLAPHRLYFVSTPEAANSKRLQVGDVDTASESIVNVRDVFDADGAGADVDHPLLSRDELELFYVDFEGKMRSTVRKRTDVAFPLGDEVAELATGSSVKPTWISADSCDLYYFTTSALGDGLHRASRR
jgi:hypothetical protein